MEDRDARFSELDGLIAAGVEQPAAEAERKPSCPSGCDAGYRRYGLDRNGNQRFQCPGCQKIFSWGIRPMSVAQGKRLEIANALRSPGATTRSVSQELGVAKETVWRCARKIIRPDCECGKKAGHRGWCSERYIRSQKRQAVMAKLNGGKENQMPGNPLIDETPKAAKVWMQSGVWSVPPDDRPKGWEAWGLKEPEPARVRITEAVISAEPPSLLAVLLNGDAEELADEMEESESPMIAAAPEPFVSKPVENIPVKIPTGEPPAKSGKWMATIERLSPLAVGASVEFVPFVGMKPEKFKSQLRCMLSTSKATCQDRWSVTTGSDRDHVRVAKVGVFPSAIDTGPEHKAVVMQARERATAAAQPSSVATVVQAQETRPVPPAPPISANQRIVAPLKEAVAECHGLMVILDERIAKLTQLRTLLEDPYIASLVMDTVALSMEKR